MSEPWYQDGLQFECTQCGKCCTGEPGYVWVSEAEIAAIAEFLKIDPAEVLAVHTRRAPRGRTIREKINGDCIYFEAGKGCTIYEVRPAQCRTWPFWESNLRTPADWQRTMESCPGSGQGQLISAEEITARLKVIRL
ncbi:YkgJ family cysteine cluster protein [Tuwongella immobilis]|uniref:Uncharacterized protein n=1 Tax=Tuwongella immobilis TaxID=692036 RepID=A0A6C2YT44_9BACT|nr:YkgJ family cysteine cluster protein [Tuwongella immobilis]VIP04890.1 Uncharacterized protein OS=Blastopirellula marina DSM 3645 GN=DSM3645_01741 PE=4 SV=1: CxxCxxCC [Tuwongella immobilis]VTS07139.1 Uncharacterized protein OS=Blastopirellula marina DSM 3645 GN=DSM3645_01741 PE=4 SV=1: CxxCxxCC [Tuwongella immobilis]